MDAFELLRQGKLQDAIDATIALVKKQPTAVDHRYNLAGLCVLQGDLDRADTHLDAISSLRPDLAVAVGVYRSCLEGEEERRRVYAGAASPGLPPETTDGLEARIRLRQQLATGGDAAAALAACQEPPVAGQLDGADFASLVDHDDTLGPVLEVFAGGRYLWVPFAGLRSLQFAAPRGLLDFLWTSCDFEDREGRRATVHVPVLYAGTSAREDPLVRYGRVTEWEDEGGIAFRGFGPRVLRADDREIPLLEVRTVRFS